MSIAAADEGDPNALKGIGLKILSVAFFVAMAACIKAAGTGVPAGQIVFFRSLTAIVPVLFYLLATGQLRHALSTNNPFGHVVRGVVGVAAMACGFYGLTRLPLPDAIALGYARPLLVIVLASVLLGEVVRVYRWSAVVVGFIGVLFISWPSLSLFEAGQIGADQLWGVVATLLSALLAAFATILVRRLVDTERTATIVLYFSLTASLLSLATFPFGWVPLAPVAIALLALSGLFGGMGQILLTESYRHAPVSTIAPFEYTSIVLGIAIGFFYFGEVPQTAMIIGTVIVTAAGLFVIVREHRLGIARKGARRFTTPQG